MACLFCGIVAGDVPAARVLDDEVAVGFLDTRPLFHGHVLLVPRDHVETLPDLPAAQIGPFFERARRLSVAVRDAMDAQGTFVAMNNVVSQSVPHLHVHVVPRRRKDGLRGFFWPRTRYADDAERDAVAGRIRGRLSAVQGSRA
jgi:histidine triad (HIT) family protein